MNGASVPPHPAEADPVVPGGLGKTPRAGPAATSPVPDGWASILGERGILTVEAVCKSHVKRERVIYNTYCVHFGAKGKAGMGYGFWQDGPL